jgi:ribosome-associated protein
MSNEQTIKRNVQKLQRTIVDALEGVKGQDIQVFNTEALSPLFERVIVASGTSNRQTRALALAVRDAVKDEGFPKPRVEGQDNGEWIIVDCAIAVVHIMQPVIRQYYRLEELWGETPVRLGRAGPKSGGTHSETFAREAIAAGASADKATQAKTRKTATGAASTTAAKAPAKKAIRASAPAKRASSRVKDDAPLREAVKATVKAQPANKSEAARPSSKAPAKKATPAATKKVVAKKTSTTVASKTSGLKSTSVVRKTVVIAKSAPRGGVSKAAPARKSAVKPVPARKAPAKRT